MPRDAAPAVAPVVVDPAAQRAWLNAFAAPRLAELDRRHPPLDGGDALIPARGGCVRPTRDERAALERAVLAANRGAVNPELRFGCVDPAGTIVDLAYDVLVSREHNYDHYSGVWRVHRVAAGKVTTLAEYRGESRQNWMEWSNESTVSVHALVDLDRDGNHDALLAFGQHEGGAMHSDDQLALWSSKTGRIGPHERVGDGAAVSFGQPADGSSLVLAIADRQGESTARYRCLEPDGRFDVCPAIAPAIAVDRERQIVACLAGECAADRDQLADMLDALHVPPAQQAPLLAGAPIPTPVVRVERLVALAVAPLSDAAHSPSTALSDELLALLGDSRCSPLDATSPRSTSASALSTTTARARIAAWIAEHDREVLVAHGDCARGARCAFQRPSAPALTASCVEGGRGYVAATWSYRAGGTMVARAGVFWWSGSALTAVAGATASGSDVECNACAPLPEATLTVELFRRGAALLALVEADEGEHRKQVFAVDGAPNDVPPGGRYSVGPRGEIVPSVIGQSTGDAMRYLHWDGSWKTIATIPYVPVAARPADPIGAWLAEQDAQRWAVGQLIVFRADEWTTKPAYRAATLRALELLHAPAATIARVRQLTP